MEENFRNVLIILSAVVITAIFIHGLWIIRKQKNPYKLKTSKDKTTPITRDFDGHGFDQDGVGQVKVSEQNTQSNQEEADVVAEHILRTGVQLPDDLSKSQILIKNDVLSDITTHKQLTTPDTEKYDNSAEPVLDSTLDANWFSDEQTPHFTKDELGDELTPVVTDNYNKNHRENNNLAATKRTYTKPLYEQPVTQQKPEKALNKTLHNDSEQALTNSSASVMSNTTSVKREHIGFDFNEPHNSQATAKVAEQSISKPDPDVVALSVVMPANQQILGAALLPSLLTLGLKYGDMNIFHRHEDNAGNGKITFSLANIMNPGSFDLDTIETFATRGVTLFMTLPNAAEPLTVFANMLNAAKQLAQEFNAQILDDKRNVMTQQTEQHYLSRIREFDRKSRIALAN